MSLAIPHLMGFTLLLQSKTQTNYAYSQLPAGRDIDNNELTTHVTIYDTLGANNTATTIVTVNQKDISVNQLNDYYSDMKASASESIDDSKVLIGSTVSVLNTNDCSNVPFNCEILNRESCGWTPNTCGSCLNGYVGVSGSSNTPCVNYDSVSVNVSTLQSVTVCEDDSECDVWSSCIDGYCASSNKTCSMDCNGRGSCRY
jgi:hypothetical protein